jgi:2-oxoglutarate dehydrogenase E1 component
MAHRGRLNVLVNVLGKMPKDLFLEFEGKHAARAAVGRREVPQRLLLRHHHAGGPVHLSLAFNPSHLEIVNPVVGRLGARAPAPPRRQDRRPGAADPGARRRGVRGQGVVMETLNLSGTRGYGTGGTVHLIVNNQIGFTTSDPRDARSTIYCTDVAKMVEAPIFHVNGDDPEAVLFVTQLALDFRQQFHKDVVIDIVCFRKLGHNEQDEPFGDAAADVQEDRQHPGTRKLYADKLVAQDVIAADEPSDDQALPRHARRRQADREPGAVQLQEQVRGRLGAVPQLQVDRRRRHARAARRAAEAGAKDHCRPEASSCTRPWRA